LRLPTSTGLLTGLHPILYGLTPASESHLKDFLHKQKLAAREFFSSRAYCDLDKSREAWPV